MRSLGGLIVSTSPDVSGGEPSELGPCLLLAQPRSPQGIKLPFLMRPAWELRLLPIAVLNWGRNSHGIMTHQLQTLLRILGCPRREPRGRRCITASTMREKTTRPQRP
jgi:hypothetical protein